LGKCNGQEQAGELKRRSSLAVYKSNTLTCDWGGIKKRPQKGETKPRGGACLGQMRGLGPCSGLKGESKATQGIVGHRGLDGRRIGLVGRKRRMVFLATTASLTLDSEETCFNAPDRVWGIRT